MKFQYTTRLWFEVVLSAEQYVNILKETDVIYDKEVRQRPRTDRKEIIDNIIMEYARKEVDANN